MSEQQSPATVTHKHDFPGSLVAGVAFDGEGVWFSQPQVGALVRVDPHTGETL